MFGFARFCFYIFIREQDLPAGGETGWLSKKLPSFDVFRRVGKLIVRLIFKRRTAIAVLFLCLVIAAFCHYNKPSFDFNHSAKFVVEL